MYSIRRPSGQVHVCASGRGSVRGLNAGTRGGVLYQEALGTSLCVRGWARCRTRPDCRCEELVCYGARERAASALLSCSSVGSSSAAVTCARMAHVFMFGMVHWFVWCVRSHSRRTVPRVAMRPGARRANPTEGPRGVCVLRLVCVVHSVCTGVCGPVVGARFPPAARLPGCGG